MKAGWDAGSVAGGPGVVLSEALLVVILIAFPLKASLQTAAKVAQLEYARYLRFLSIVNDDRIGRRLLTSWCLVDGCWFQLGRVER